MHMSWLLDSTTRLYIAKGRGAELTQTKEEQARPPEHVLFVAENERASCKATVVLEIGFGKTFFLFPFDVKSPP